MSNENPEIIEEVILTPEDETDLEQLYTEEDGEPLVPKEAPEFHTVLEVWREILKPAAAESKKKITPQWANRMISTYPKLDYSDITELRDSYFDHIAELNDLLLVEIDTDDDCLSWPTPEEDVEFNSVHYKNLLRDWQLATLQWELDWSTTDDNAAVQLAAIGEAHKMFFGDTGLTAFLDNIKLQFTEEDQMQMVIALNERRAEHGQADE